MKFLEKICLKIILKVTKNQGVNFSVEDTFFEKPQGGGGPAVLGLTDTKKYMPLSFNQLLFQMSKWTNL